VKREFDMKGKEKREGKISAKRRVRLRAGGQGERNRRLTREERDELQHMMTCAGQCVERRREECMRSEELRKKREKNQCFWCMSN
jgi:hypothetical protein